MPEFSYADFYRQRSVELAQEVKRAAEEYANNPEGDTWARLEHASLDWQRAHAAWRAMACHKI